DLARTEKQYQAENLILEQLDKKIHLMGKKVRLFNTEIHNKQQDITVMKREIVQLQGKIQNLQDMFKKQAVFAYKYHRGQQLDWILGAENFNQALIRFRYFQKISALERDIFLELNNSRREREEKQARLEQDLHSVQQLLAALESEEKQVRETQLRKSAVVKRISHNKQLLSKAINEKRESYEKIKHMIARLEKERSSRQLSAPAQQKWDRLSGGFIQNKGKLNWPVSGKLLHEFGQYRNPKLKTVMQNTGIDIRAEHGQNVRCVFPGIISMITYLSGFGNIVIVDHNDSYYTVYGHLDQIFVNAGSFIDDGAALGTVGTSGSLEGDGPLLHFELYGNNKPLNPLHWLKKFN
ncbi:MAG: peptidoglycan DD-metalloendopeptidase family protein, partial [Calditrichia bacterium]